MSVDEERELDRYIAIAQDAPRTLINRMQEDPDFLARVNARLSHYAAMERIGRLGACWVSRRGQKTLRAALAAIDAGSAGKES